MKRLFACILFFAVGTVAISQTVTDITPTEPGIKILYVSGGGSTAAQTLYALLNRDSIQGMALYSEKDLWYNLPFPKKVSKVQQLVGMGHNAFILALNEDGEQVLWRWQGRWVEIACRKLGGTIDYIFPNGESRLTASGTFKIDGKPAMIALLNRGDEWTPGISLFRDQQEAARFASGTIERIFSDGGSFLLKDPAGTYYIGFAGMYGWDLSDALPGPAYDVAMHGRESATVLGTTAAGGTYVLEGIKKWKPVDTTGIPLSSIEKVYDRYKKEPIFQGTAKNGDGRVLARRNREGKWGATNRLIEADSLLVNTNESRYYVIDPSGHVHRYVLTEFNARFAYKNDVPPITLVADANMIELNNRFTKQVAQEKFDKRKKAWDGIKTIEDLMTFYHHDDELRSRNAFPDYKRMQRAGGGVTKEQLDDAKTESVFLRADLLVYKNKASAFALQGPPRDAALSDAFYNYLSALYDRATAVNTVLSEVLKGSVTTANAQLPAIRQADSKIHEQSKLLTMAIQTYSRTAQPSITDMFKKNQRKFGGSDQEQLNSKVVLRESGNIRGEDSKLFCFERTHCEEQIFLISKTEYAHTCTPGRRKDC